jgi:MFS family permease
MAFMFVPLGIGNAVSQPSLQSIISRFSPPQMRGRVLGAFQSANSSTLVIGPLLTGFLLEIDFSVLFPQIGAAMPMFMATLLMVVALPLSMRILRMTLPTQEPSA